MCIIAVMIKFNKMNVHDQKIDQWIELGVNVVLIGGHGTGKTQRILEGFERNELKYAYFSGATIDPWLHLIGVPEITGDNGNRKLDFILPQNIDENIEAIFIDEYNRTPKIVRNALLELQQFKTINGRSFPKLKVVWAAINPPKDDEDDSTFAYDVDEPDMAQLDRFHVIVEIPSIPDIKYFKKVFGDYFGGNLVAWWKSQPKEVKKSISPRRLEYVGKLFKAGVAPSDMLPVGANINDLIERIGVSEDDIILEEILKTPNSDQAKKFLGNPKKVYENLEKLREPKYFKTYKHLPDEIKEAEYIVKGDFKNYVLSVGVTKDSRHWTRQLVKNVDDEDSLKKVGKVLPKDWMENTSIAVFDPNLVDFPISRSDGKNKEDLKKIEEALKAEGNYEMPRGFKKNILKELPSQSFTNTYHHKRMFYYLRGAHDLVEPEFAINALISLYHSMQQGTIDQIRGFDKIFNRIFASCFCKLYEEERIKVRSLVGNLKGKHKSFNQLVEFVNSTSSNTELSGDVPNSVSETIELALKL
jgi:hypothetical protein